jgi:hypothetical protein
MPQKTRLDSPLSWALAYATIASGTVLLILVPAALFGEGASMFRLKASLVLGAIAALLGVLFGLIQLGTLNALAKKPIWMVLLVMAGLGALGGMGLIALGGPPLFAIGPDTESIMAVLQANPWSEISNWEHKGRVFGWAAFLGMWAAGWVWLPFIFSKGKSGKRFVSVAVGTLILPATFWILMAINR